MILSRLFIRNNRLEQLEKENKTLKDKLSLKQKQINDVNRYYKHKLKSLKN